jgi:hypothetical protein
VVINASDAVVALQAHADRLTARGIASDRVTTRSCVLQPHLCFGSAEVAPPPAPSTDSSFHTFGGGMTVVVATVVTLMAAGIITACVVWRRNENARANYRRKRGARGYVNSVQGTRPLLQDHDRGLSPRSGYTSVSPRSSLDYGLSPTTDI